ncbi:MAG: hypothetical protein AAGI53_13285, partial [Planctomycetota bacterium]
RRWDTDRRHRKRSLLARLPLRSRRPSSTEPMTKDSHRLWHQTRGQVTLGDPLGLSVCTWEGTLNVSMWHIGASVEQSASITAVGIGKDGCRFAVRATGKGWGITADGGGGIQAGMGRVTLAIDFKGKRAPCQWPIRFNSTGYRHRYDKSFYINYVGVGASVFSIGPALVAYDVFVGGFHLEAWQVFWGGDASLSGFLVGGGFSVVDIRRLVQVP